MCGLAGEDWVEFSGQRDVESDCFVIVFLDDGFIFATVHVDEELAEVRVSAGV